MIPINELRIGNKFYYPPFYDGGKGDCIGEIESIYMQDAYPSEGFICLINIELETEYDSPIAKSDYNNKNINPIPLTPEILEMCGYKYWNIDHNCTDPNDAYWVHPKMKFAINNIKWTVQKLDIQIQYLHQLQNLYFALTGQELDINM